MFVDNWTGALQIQPRFQSGILILECFICSKNYAKFQLVFPEGWKCLHLTEALHSTVSD